jgi:plasmid stabilization system protein ParE
MGLSSRHESHHWHCRRRSNRNSGGARGRGDSSSGTGSRVRRAHHAYRSRGERAPRGDGRHSPGRLRGRRRPTERAPLSTVLRFRIRVSPRATAQIRVAARWWSENRPKAPEALEEELARGFELASAFPSAGEPVPRTQLSGVRRVLLGRIRYHLYYSVSHETKTVEILALWHTSRGSTPKL